MKIRVNIIFILVMLVAMVMVTACTHGFNISKDIDIGREGVTKIPLRLGVLMDVSYCNYVYTKKRSPDKFEFIIGESLCKGTEKVFKSIFLETTMLGSWDSGIDDKGINIIVVPEVVSAGFMFPGLQTRYAEAIVTVKYTFYDNNKRIVWVDTFQGVNKRKLGWLLTMKSNMRKCMKSAIEDHYKKLMDDLFKRQWWKTVDVNKGESPMHF